MASLTFLFLCPCTRLMVQASADEPADDGSQSRVYTRMRCTACSGWHLVNPKTGKLVSEEGQSAA